jgi:hypothetical protein
MSTPTPLTYRYQRLDHPTYASFRCAECRDLYHAAVPAPAGWICEHCSWPAPVSECALPLPDGTYVLPDHGPAPASAPTPSDREPSWGSRL